MATLLLMIISLSLNNIPNIIILAKIRKVISYKTGGPYENYYPNEESQMPRTTSI
jgi:hypothetical protein